MWLRPGPPALPSRRRRHALRMRPRTLFTLSHPYPPLIITNLTQSVLFHRFHLVSKGRALAETPTDRTRLVATTANRLRLIQVDFADESPDVRAGYLADEVQRAIGKLPPDQRPAFLDELKARFPTWDGQVGLGTPSQAAAPTQSPMDARELRDPSFLATRLIELAPTLIEEQKRALATRLAEVGLVQSGGGGPEWPAAPLKTLRTKLAFADADNLDAARTLELLSELVALANSLDQLVWSTWRQVATKSTLKRQNPLQRTMARFAAGDQDVARANVTQDVEKLRQLTASLIAAIGQIGRQFMQRHLHKFQPDEIQALVQSEKSGGMFVSEEVKCWRKYKDLAHALNEATVESEIQNAIAEYAETLIKGLSR